MRNERATEKVKAASAEGALAVCAVFLAFFPPAGPILSAGIGIVIIGVEVDEKLKDAEDERTGKGG